MANRAMDAKLLRARAQTREAAALEFTKPAYILQTSKHELRAIAALYDGAMVRRVPGAPPHWQPAKLYSDGTRRGSILTADVYGAASRLIRKRSEGLHG